MHNPSVRVCVGLCVCVCAAAAIMYVHMRVYVCLCVCLSVSVPLHLSRTLTMHLSQVCFLCAASCWAEAAAKICRGVHQQWGGGGLRRGEGHCSVLSMIRGSPAAGVARYSLSLFVYL